AVGVLSDSMAARHRDRLVARTIADVEEPALLALVWRTGHGPAVRELLARGRQAFGASAAISSGATTPAVSR
ncbi:hypothetical protein AB0392_40485, partial [Nonomuraea angiospora]